MPANRSAYGFQGDEFDALYEHGRINDGRVSNFNTAFPALPHGPSSEPPLVTIEQLRHPLTGKARRWLAKAFSYAKRGEHALAISTLREGVMKEKTLAPYAHGLLGIEYLRTGRNREAVPELAEAVSLFPHDAVVRSNFAISLCVVGEFDRAEQETKLALYLEPTLESAQELMRMIAVDKEALASSVRK
jgi:tetratricopeptide (TPR) repeat protein